MFSVSMLIISLTAFIVVFIYERLHRNVDITLLLTFSLSAFFFALVYFIKIPVLNVGFIVIAIMSSNGAATMLWSHYCPSLKDTGVVSGATGFLDFLSYMAAAVANKLFADAVTQIGWGNLILVWTGLMALDAMICLPWQTFFRKKTGKAREENCEN